jgi:hypothetical protein
MSTQLAQLELAPPVTSETTPRHFTEDDVLDAAYQAGVARGIINAVLIATPFWALVAFVLYRLL